MRDNQPDCSSLDFIYKDPKEIASGVPFPKTPGKIQDYEVHMFGEDDPENPISFSGPYKAFLLVIMAYIILVPSWGSAVSAADTHDLQEIYHIGLPVATLQVSLYVIGFAVGPIVWGPMTSIYGRKVPLFLGTFGNMIFMFASAASQDLQTLLLTRFFQGAFGVALLNISPSLTGDMFSNLKRGSAMSVICLCVMAPMLAPIVGGYIEQSYLGWRWTFYITGIMGALSCVLIAFVLPETFHPTILQQRAQRLRDKTGNHCIRAPGDLTVIDPKELLNRVLAAPIRILFQEAILALVTIYHGFIYGILYLCLEAVPIIFSGYHFKGANIYLPYIAMLIGGTIICILNVLIFEKDYNRCLLKYNVPVVPERRLVLMMVCGLFFASGIFWMCWAGAYAQHVHWIVPCIGASFVGVGIIGIFLAAFNYLMDTYLHLSSIVFAANTFLRSAFGCAFPLFVHPLFINLGTQWAGTLIGCLAALMVPVPFAFFFFGAKLRSISPYAINLDDVHGDTSQEYEEQDSEDGQAWDDYLHRRPTRTETRHSNYHKEEEDVVTDGNGVADHE